MPATLRALVAASLLALTALPAASQTYPDRVVRIVNPFPPGGSVDVMARLLAQKLSDSFGHQFIVENRAGAGGNTGAEGVAKSDPDGYTLLFSAPGPLAINQALYTKGLPFDPEKDFAPLALFATTPLVLMVNNDLPVKNVKELIDLAKAKPGAINFASAGSGSTPHLSGELFKSMAKVEITHVPYRGTGPAMNDLIGGHIQMFFDLLPSSLPQIETGKVRGIANASATRAKQLSNLPTVAEQALPGFSTSSWFGLVAPVKTPAAVQAKLIAEIRKILAQPDVIAKLQDLGSEPGNAFGDDFRTFMAAETKKWSEVIRVSGAKAD